jgi:hypothetical protein
MAARAGGLVGHQVIDVDTPPRRAWRAGGPQRHKAADSVVHWLLSGRRLANATGPGFPPAFAAPHSRQGMLQ